MSNMHAMGILEGKKRQKKTETLWEEIIVKNLQNCFSCQSIKFKQSKEVIFKFNIFKIL